MTVTLTVTPVQDGPVATDDGPIAVTGKPVTINVLANDSGRGPRPAVRPEFHRPDARGG